MISLSAVSVILNSPKIFPLFFFVKRSLEKKTTENMYIVTFLFFIAETAATDYGVEECPCAEATTTEGRVPSRLSGNGADSGGGGDRSPRGPFLRFLQRRGRGGLRGSGVGSFRGRNGVAYLVRLFPFWKRRFLIKFDRLQLGALFDQ